MKKCVLKRLIKEIIKESILNEGVYGSDEITDAAGSRVAYVKDGDTARIWDAKAIIPKTGFFTNAIKELKRRGFKTIKIRIQSSNMRETLRRLVKNGVLINPRDFVGISVDEHPSTFDINPSLIVTEITQKDIKMRHPNNPSFYDKTKDQPWDMSKMTLDNLKALKVKTQRTIQSLKSDNKISTESKTQWIGRLVQDYKMYDDEIKKRLQYINKPVSEQNRGLGYNHNSTSDARNIPSVRDELNDPRLNGKLHEGQYKFDDFNWMKRGDGFGIPSDVYYGTILLGVIVSQENGYLIGLVKGPNGDRSYRQDPKKPFKTKDDAAEALHRAWKYLRHGEETKSF